MLYITKCNKTSLALTIPKKILFGLLSIFIVMNNYLVMIVDIV